MTVTPGGDNDRSFNGVARAQVHHRTCAGMPIIPVLKNISDCVEPFDVSSQRVLLPLPCQIHSITLTNSQFKEKQMRAVHNLSRNQIKRFAFQKRESGEYFDFHNPPLEGFIFEGQSCAT